MRTVACLVVLDWVVWLSSLKDPRAIEKLLWSKWHTAELVTEALEGWMVLEGINLVQKAQPRAKRGERRDEEKAE